MKTLSYNGYLDEIKLGVLLEDIFGKNSVTRQSKEKIFGHNYKPDFKITLDTKILLVEFDGPRHYTQFNTIERDELVKEYCDQNDILFVQIPYFIQFDEESFKWLFGIDLYEKYIFNKFNILNQSWPHGFISKSSSCILPYDFINPGFKRFLKEINEMPVMLRDSIRKSLTNRQKETKGFNFLKEHNII